MGYEFEIDNVYGGELGDMLEEMLGAGAGAGIGAMVAAYLVMFLIAAAVGVAYYVLQSISIYKIASRRGIDRPWLAWVPVVNVWTLGCISDQYQYVVNGKNCNKRTTMLVLNIILKAITILISCCYAGMVVQMMEAGGMGEVDVFSGAFATAVVVVLLALVAFGVGIALAIIQYMALYDLFRSCDSANGTLYLIGCILVNTIFSAFSFLQPVFLFLCRDKDDGMPPRRPTTYT